MINWKNLTSIEDLKNAVSESHNSPVAIFKHSTRCSVSLMAKKGIEMTWDMPNVQAYYLDLIRFRDVSNFIASEYEVEHQSPQLIGFKNGEVFYHASHGSATADSLKSALTI